MRLLQLRSHCLTALAMQLVMLSPFHLARPEEDYFQVSSHLYICKDFQRRKIIDMFHIFLKSHFNANKISYESG
jgi:hypothetical protein